jgi:hypothetical protein
MLAAAAPLPVVTLPAVHVRSVAAHPPKLPAAAVLVAAQAATIAAGATVGSGGTSLPSLRLDMPYYSFGKLLPRVGKE